MTVDAGDGEPRQTMMALRAHERGGAEELIYETAPRPEPGSGEVLIRVEAAGITFDELTWPETWESKGVPRTPIIPSHEVAGRVASVGDRVDDLVVGDSVFGLVPFDRDGAAADYVVVPRDAVAKRSGRVSALAAAASVLPALTAWEALTEHASAAPGARILVRGGTGAVGSFLTQFAHVTGMEVTATVSRHENAELATTLGADHVVIVPRGEAPRIDDRFDVAIDAVGGSVPAWMYSAVAPGGRLIVLQEPPRRDLLDDHGIEGIFFVVHAQRERLEELAARLATGTVAVSIAATFPLSEGRIAYASGSLPSRKPGKTLLLVDAEPAS